MFSFIKPYHSACPTAIHGDLEQGVVRRHSLRSAGGVAGSDEQGGGQRGVREGGRHGEDKVAVNSALWEEDTTTSTHTHTQLYKGQMNKRSEISGGN